MMVAYALHEGQPLSLDGILVELKKNNQFVVINIASLMAPSVCRGTFHTVMIKPQTNHEQKF